MEAVRAGELEEFAAAVLAGDGEGGLPPITPQRARAQARNPVADPEDIVLFAAYSGKRLVGYLGALPGWLRRGASLSKVNWGSTWYLHPDYRKTAAGLLMGRNFKRRLPDIVFTDLSPEAWKLIHYLGASELGSCRYYRLRLKRFPGRLKGLVCRILLPAPPAGVAVRETDRVREEAHPVIRQGAPPAEFYRGPRVVNWILEYPWVVETGRPGTDKLDYLFTHRRKLFRITANEVFGPGGEYRGYFVVSFSSTGRERTMKILDYDFLHPEDRSLVLPLALECALRARADIVNIPGELIPSAGRASLLRRLARPHDRPYLYYPWTGDSPLAKAAGEVRLNYCDGDTAFT
ncbi:MAG: hypothetical protein P9M08_05615 [Candidatus Erginobacter occultus]|nr:hypothetical protein [Candidatus Erginobacter occultus]